MGLCQCSDKTCISTNICASVEFKIGKVSLGNGVTHLVSAELLTKV